MPKSLSNSNGEKSGRATRDHCAHTHTHGHAASPKWPRRADDDAVMGNLLLVKYKASNGGPISSRRRRRRRRAFRLQWIFVVSTGVRLSAVCIPLMNWPLFIGKLAVCSGCDVSISRHTHADTIRTADAVDSLSIKRKASAG